MSMGNPAGQPSMITPRAGPWLSPKVDTRNALPKMLPAKVSRFCEP